MLTKNDLLDYLARQSGLTEKGRDFVLKTFESPSRMVGRYARKNVVTFPFSERADMTLSAESRGPEAGFLTLTEYEEDVLLPLDQPEPVTLRSENKNGKITTSSYTVDFLILRRDYLEAVEVKTTNEIERLIAEKPKRWKRIEDGSVEYLPAKLAFREMAIHFRVFEYNAKKRYLIENIECLMWSRAAGDANGLTRPDLDKAFNQSFCWTLADLKDFFELKEMTPLVRCIDRGELFIDMERSLISNPKGCIVGRSPIYLQLGYASLDKGKIFEADILTAIETSDFPSEAEAKRALDKLDKLNSGLSNRSTRRWLKKIAKGKEIGLSEFQSLISNYQECGNRTRRVFVDVENYLDSFLRTEHPESNGISVYRSYVKYRVGAKDEHPFYDPVSRRTFAKRLLRLPPELVAEVRGGARAANAAAEPTDPEERNIKAQYPWQAVTIDHYLADIELIFFANQNEVFVLRPWITAMVDIYSKEVLAVVISFKSPSRVACAKVIRECVRRHGKLPREIIVDRGSEFRSTFFASLLAHFKIKLTLRPAGNPKWGSEVERLFGQFKDLWLSQLPGNRADKREVRSADGKCDPKKHAIFQPYEFYRALLSFCDWLSTRCVGNAFESTAVKFERKQSDFPFIAIEVAYDASFQLATAVDVERYKIDFQRGLHISGIWYWSPRISIVRGFETHLDVRVDPENPNVVYAKVRDSWVPCYNSEINTYSAKDSILQKVEGLIIREGQSEREDIRLHADEQLVKKIKDMTKMAEDALVVPVLEVEAAESSSPASIFDRIKSSKVSSLQLENWDA